MFRLFVFVLFASIGFAARCRNGQQIIAKGVSESDKNVIVAVHNQLRNDISNGRVPDQPRGTNLKPMVYDDQLGKKAEIVSNTCKMEHITVNDDRFWWVGQNIYSEWKSWQSEQNWTAAVTSWFSENKDFTYPDRTAAGKVTGHYTQVVWADSTNVGCDYIQYLDNVQGRNMYASLYTCNYGPGGNIMGEAPYRRG